MTRTSRLSSRQLIHGGGHATPTGLIKPRVGTEDQEARATGPRSSTGRVALPLTAWLAIESVAVIDLGRVFGIQGATTVATLALIALPSIAALAHVKATGQRSTHVPIWHWLFVTWGLLSLALVDRAPQGMQNVVLYLLFVLGVSYTSTMATLAAANKTLRLLRNAAIFATVLWVPTLVSTGLGTDGVLVTRGAASMACVIGLIASVGIPPQRRSERAIPWYFILIIGLTLSRIALVFAGVYLIASAFRNRERLTRSLVLKIIVLSTAGYLLATRFPPLQRRFSQNDNESIAGLRVGTSGRSNLWSALTERMTSDKMWLGNGAGAAEQTISSVFIRISQPHNDYLRILFDLGWIGLAFFVFTLLSYLNGSIRRWRLSGPADQGVHLAAILSVICIVLYSALDNIVVYIFAMLPLGVMIGLSIGVANLPSASIAGAVPSGRALRSDQWYMPDRRGNGRAW